MGSYSDSTSDLDEDLPVFDFLQPDHILSQSHREQTALGILGRADMEKNTCYGVDPGRAAGGLDPGDRMSEVMIISSEDEDVDVPDVPLALRLKQREEGLGCNNRQSGLVLSGQNRHSESHQTINGHLRMENVRGGEPDLYHPMGLALPKLGPLSKPCFTAGSTFPDKQRPAKRAGGVMQASKDEARSRREAREMQRREKEARKLEQDRQKVEKKAQAEAVKAMRPEECIKHVVVSVDPALLQLEGGGTLLTSLHALGCSCAIEKQPLPRSVSWVRRTPTCQTGEVVCIPEAHTVMQVQVEDFITLAHSSSQEQRAGGTDCSLSLTSWTQSLLSCNPGKMPCLVVIDLEKYFRSQKSQNQKKFRSAVLGEEQVTGKQSKKRSREKAGCAAVPEISRVEVEEAVVHLQLHTGVQVCFLSTWKEFSHHIVMATKAVAEAPFKRQREETGFSFYLDSEWAGGHKVDRAGKGLLQVWKRQIQQLNRVSPDMASAILTAYPSPQLLMQAYSQCKSEREKLSLLSDLLIRRGEGVTSTTRRVGPELSKRLYLVMMSSDPQQTVDSTL